MKQVGIDRNYYDMDKRQPIPQYNLELINGFSASISSYEDRLLLCTELTHKLLHKTTVLNLMREAYSNNPQGFREMCIARCVGRTVMTQYNNKTYQIHDISWDSSPETTFDFRGEKITFIQYYKQVGLSLKKSLILVLFLSFFSSSNMTLPFTKEISHC